MKKRISLMAAVIITIILCLSVSACSLAGKSAYEIACDNGFPAPNRSGWKALKGKTDKILRL